MPTADQRNGIFTSTIKDPVTGQPFANNTIPADRIDPFAAAILQLVPLPNQPGVNNFFRNANLIDNSDRLLTRGDWKPSPKDSIFGRYIYSNRDREIPGAFGGVLDGTGTSAFGNQKIKTNAFVGGWTRVLSSTMVNEARFSCSRSRSDAVQQSFGLTPPTNAQHSRDDHRSDRGRRVPRNLDHRLLRRLGPRPSRFAGLPAEVPAHRPVRVPRHAVVAARQPRVQVRHRHHRADEEPVLRRSGHAGLATRSAASFTASGLADYLLGYVSGFQLSNVYVVDQRHWATMFFVQDDWKATDR